MTILSEKKRLLIGALLGALLAICIMLVFTIMNKDEKHGSTNETNPQPVQSQQNEEVEEKKPLEEEPEPVITKETIELAMIGDILLHTELAVYDDFSPSFAPVEQSLLKPDYLIANQESLPIASKFGISGYPQFSSPDYLVTDLKEAGVDMLNLANNHAVDKWEDGLALAIQNIENANIPYVGAYKSAEDRATHRIVEVKGIKIGVVSYTYGTNGLVLPEGSPYIVNYIDIEQMTKDVATLKPLVDVTVAIIHWGAEYVTKHNEDQAYISMMMNQAGVDIIFGGHPHVLQPYEKIVNGSGQETHVFYSLGNFFARTITSKDSNIGAIGSFEITKEGETITIDKPKIIATSLLKDNADGRYKVYPLAEVQDRSIRDLIWVQNVVGEQVIVQ